MTQFLTLKIFLLWTLSNIYKSTDWYKRNSKLGTSGSHLNPSYSGDREQEDHGLKLPGQIVLKTLSRKKTITKRGWWSGSRYRP
jgi:hypothetical protein